MKFFSVVLQIILVLSGAAAQVTFTSFPRSKQLLPRNTGSNLAQAVISGTVSQNGTPYTEIRIKIYRDNLLQSTLQQPLVYSNGVAGFSISCDIPAELHQYKLEAYGADSSGSEFLLKKVNQVVAGDVYLVQGQSNADAGMYAGSASAYESKYIRAYGNGYSASWPKKWYYATGDFFNATPGHAGQWGLVLAGRIVDETGIPVAIINGAEGGQPISFFQRNDGDPQDPLTNYGRTLKRIAEAGVQNSIRAVLWYQGESNAFGTSTASYKTSFQSLHSDWLDDFPSIERVYLFQIRFGCGQSQNNTLKIQEALRQLVQENSTFRIMSTNGTDHHTDQCHFPFINGYELDGINISRLMLADLYAMPETLNSDAPAVASVAYAAPDQLLLTLINSSDTYTWEAGSENDFRISGDNDDITGGSINGNVLTLHLTGPLAEGTTLSYSGHPGPAGPNPKNANGIGLLSFNKLPIDNLRTMETTTTGSFEVFPNPSPGNMFIRLPEEPTSVITWEIADVAGRTLRKGQFTEASESGIYGIDGEGLPPGNYRLVVMQFPERKMIRVNIY